LFGALRLGTTLWLTVSLYANMVLVVAGYWRGGILSPLVWLLGQGSLVYLTRRDPSWDDRMLLYLQHKRFPSAKGGQ
jgi:hypothetical protein